MDEITKYDGWSNRATWHVNLLMNNTRAPYDEMRSARPLTEESTQLLVIKHFRSDISPAELESINWYELSEDWNIEDRYIYELANNRDIDEYDYWEA